MLLKVATLRGIACGDISLQFRRWRRPTVKGGGTLLTPVGQLSIEDVEPVEIESITVGDARDAGFPDLDALLSALGPSGPARVYRIRLSLLGPDPRLELRERVPSEAEVEEIRGRLQRFDSRASGGAWTSGTLRAIDERPGVRAQDLAGHLGMERSRFKSNVRKLKELGLTESLEVGYRLSPRGKEILKRLDVDG